jgi:hypothetical protein
MLTNLQLTDVSNFFSDFILAIGFLFWAIRIQRFDIRNPFFSTWATFFLLMSASAVTGAFGHLLQVYVGIWGKLISWAFLISAIWQLEKGLVQYLMLPRWLVGFSDIKALATTIILLTTHNFICIKVNTTIGIVFIVCTALVYLYRLSQNRAYLTVVFGLLLNSIASVVHAQKIYLHAWCDHNDLAHYITLGSFSVAFGGLKSLQAAFIKAFES